MIQVSATPRLRAAPSKAPTKGARTRRRLLAAAERVFGRHGYHAASIADITREAGVALGTFYVHFPSKRELFVELVRTRGHELRAELARATASLESRAAVERRGLETFLAWVRRHPAIYRIVRNAEFVDPEVYREWYERLAAGYARALARAQRRGEVARGHAEALAYCAMAVGDFTGMRWVLWEPGRRIPPRVLETAVAFVLRGLGIADHAMVTPGPGR